MSNELLDATKRLSSSVQELIDTNTVQKLHIETLKERLKDREELVQKLRGQLNDALTAARVFSMQALYNQNGSRKIEVAIKARSEQPASTTTGRVSSQPPLTELLRTPEAAKVFKKPAYSGLQGHSVGAQYPYCVVGIETQHGTRYRIQHLLTGKFAGWSGTFRQWSQAAPASAFIDRLLEGHTFDTMGRAITWIA